MNKEMTYKPPDENFITIGAEHFRCAEVLLLDRSQRCSVYSFTATSEREISRNVQKKLCYIRLDYDTQLKSTEKIDKEETHVLPDRNISTVGAERFRCVEVLFQPFPKI